MGEGKNLALRHKKDLKRALNAEQVQLGEGSLQKDWENLSRAGKTERGKKYLSIWDTGKSLPL